MSALILFKLSLHVRNDRIANTVQERKDNNHHTGQEKVIEDLQGTVASITQVKRGKRRIRRIYLNKYSIRKIQYDIYELLL